MNIFPGSSAVFRRGSTLEDGTTTSSGAPLLSIPRTMVVPPSLVQPSAAAAAAASPPASPPPSSSPFRPLPTTPYYGLLSKCEVHVTVAVDDSAELSGCNAPSLLHRLGHLQRLLGDVAERHGAVYHFGTDTGPRDAAAPPRQQQQQQQPTLSLSCSPTYGAYVDAMQDGLRQMSALRASCGPTVRSSHAFYMRVLGHPVWRDLSAMLCVEDGRLLLCVLSSSRVTQRRLTSACRRANVALEWVGGAALVVEPSSMSAVEVNPVWVVWEAVLHLPLLTPAAGGAAAAASAEERPDDAGDTAAAASASAGVRAALETARSGATTLRGFEVTLVSSLLFHGARRCCPVGRFTEEAAVMSEDVPAVASVRRLVARRYVWRLLPSFHWVLPHFLVALLRCLVERCGLRAFTLRCGPAAGGGAVNTAGEGRRGVAAKSNTASGVQLVASDAPTSLTVRRGTSPVSWVAFSRLSSADWIDDETREALMLGGTGGLMDDPVGGEDSDDDVEVEFDLTSIHYERAVPFAASSKRERSVPLLIAGGGEAAAAAERDEGLCDDMQSWGSCFRLGVAMRRVIVVDDAEE